jgi:hypothetical protein
LPLAADVSATIAQVPWITVALVASNMMSEAAAFTELLVISARAANSSASNPHRIRLIEGMNL